MLDIDLSLVVYSGIIFLILLLILNNILFKPLMKHMDDRKHAISSDMNVIEKNEKAMLDLQNKIDSLLEDAKKDARSIKELALNEAKLKLDNFKIAVQQENDNNYKVFIKELSIEKENLKIQLLTEKETLLTMLKNKIA